MRAYATMQKLLCHVNYCELVLSPVRASFKQPSAARPATGPTNSVAHPSIRGEQRRRRTMSAQQIAPNPRQLITRSPPRCRTSIIQSSALVQASFSLSMVALAARLRRSFPKNFYFRHFFPRVFLVCVCVCARSLTKSFFRPSQPGPCARLSLFLLCVDCTCVLVCMCLCMCM